MFIILNFSPLTNHVSNAMYGTDRTSPALSYQLLGSIPVACPLESTPFVHRERATIWPASVVYRISCKSKFHYS